MSLGHQQVLHTEHIAVIISGEKKKKLTAELLSYAEFNPEFPLSIISHPQLRHRVSVYISLINI